MAASVTGVLAPLHFLMEQFWFVTVIPRYLNCDTLSNAVCYIYIPILVCMRHQHIISFPYSG
jgi:hypothetical protein